mgnify:CR=1 FL=1
MPDIVLANATRRSDAIAIARVICILGVVYVHAWTGRNGQDLELLRGSPQEGLRWVLMEIFGRSAVPLLGLISGWLVGGSARTRNWFDHVGRKARTILLPMLLWNAVAILLVSGAAWLLGLSAPVPQSGGWIAEELFIINRNPDINVQMPFLRDLFLCMVAAPLLVRLPNWMLMAVALAALSCQIAGLGPPVLMRPSILFFFTIGILARREGWADRAAAVPMLAASLPFGLLMGAQLYVSLKGGAGLAPLAARYAGFSQRQVLWFTLLYPAICFFLLWGGSIWGPIVAMLGFVVLGLAYRLLQPLVGVTVGASLSVVAAILWWLFLDVPVASALASAMPIGVEAVESLTARGKRALCFDATHVP